MPGAYLINCYLFLTMSVIHDTMLITTRTTTLSVRGGNILDMGFMDASQPKHPMLKEALACWLQQFRGNYEIE